LSKHCVKDSVTNQYSAKQTQFFISVKVIVNAMQVLTHLGDMY